MTSEITREHGGRRANAGRPPGRKGNKTIARQIAINNAIDETLSKLTGEEIQRFTPLEVMILAMHLLLQSRDLAGAVAAAREAAPYYHSKLGANVPELPIPDDLLSDPAPTPDEPGPANPRY